MRGVHALEAQSQVGSSVAQVGQRSLGHRDRLLPLTGQREHAGQLERCGIAQHAVGRRAERPGNARSWPACRLLSGHAQLEAQRRPQLAAESLAQRAGEIGDGILGRSSGQRPGRSLAELHDHFGAGRLAGQQLRSYRVDLRALGGEQAGGLAVQS